MTQRRFQRNAASDLLRVGVITGPGGHTANIWGEKMTPRPGQRTTGMLMTHAFCLNSDFRHSPKNTRGDPGADPREMVDHIERGIRR